MSRIDRIWQTATRPLTLGALLMAAGLLLAVMPLAEMPAGAEGWWTAAYRADAVLSLAMTAVAISAVFATGWLFETAGRTSWSQWLGPLVMGIAVCAGLAHWVSMQRGVESTRQTIAVGETVQSFSGTLAGETLDVMYRDRVEVTDIQTSPSPMAVVRTFRPGEVGQTRRSKLTAGASIGVGDYRLTFIGFSREEGGLEAVISSNREDTITASAPVGGSFALTVDGDSYKVEEVVENYLGSVGPAARVSRGDIGTVWVFQRSAGMEQPPAFDHDLVLESVRRAPAAVFLVSRSSPVWPINAVGILFILGVVGTLFFRVEGDDGRQA